MLSHTWKNSTGNHCFIGTCVDLHCNRTILQVHMGADMRCSGSGALKQVQLDINLVDQYTKEINFNKIQIVPNFFLLIGFPWRCPPRPYLAPVGSARTMCRIHTSTDPTLYKCGLGPLFSTSGNLKLIRVKKA